MANCPCAMGFLAKSTNNCLTNWPLFAIADFECKGIAKRLQAARRNLGSYELPKWKARPAKATDGRIARQYRGQYTTEMSFDERMEDWRGRCAA